MAKEDSLFDDIMLDTGNGKRPATSRSSDILLNMADRDNTSTERAIDAVADDPLVYTLLHDNINTALWDSCKDYSIRLYRTTLLSFLFITSAYGLLSFSFHFYGHRTQPSDLGVAWVESSARGQNVLAFTAEFDLANKSDDIIRLFKLNTRGIGVGFVKNNYPHDTTLRIVFKLYPDDNTISDRQTNYHNSTETSERLKRSIRDDDLPLPLDWEQFAAYGDDYPVQLNIHLDNSTSPSDTAEADEEENEIIKPILFDPYAEKCREYWNDFQQKQVFMAANEELQKIRKNMENVLHAGKNDKELDVKDSQSRDQKIHNQMLVRQTIYEVLKRFGGTKKSIK